MYAIIIKKIYEGSGTLKCERCQYYFSTENCSIVYNRDKHQLYFLCSSCIYTEKFRMPFAELP